MKDAPFNKTAIDFARNLGGTFGHFDEIILMIENEYEYNDADTYEHKLSKYLLCAIEKWVVDNLIE